MRTLKQLLKQKPIFLNLWDDKIDVISDFEGIGMSEKEYKAETAPYPNVKYWEEKKEKMAIKLESYKDINILFASYGCDNYAGDAWLLFERDGKLYEVNGSHCSCFGLEEQFEPEETALEAIKLRLEKGSLGTETYAGNSFESELKQFLGL